jgi:hypothetical protein
VWTAKLYRTYNQHFGPTGDPATRVAQGARRVFNPALPQAAVDRAYERDPDSAAAEFGALFRDDISSPISAEALAAVVASDCAERGPEPGRANRLPPHIGASCTQLA